MAFPVAVPLSIPLASPEIDESDIRAVNEVLRSGNLSCGPWVERFESELAERVGVREAVAVSNGTAALHLIVKALGIGPEDEVVTTPYSFVASSNCILFEGARPVFADIDPLTYNLDPAAAEAAITPRTKAILAVDVFGRLADWPALDAIARKHGLRLIDDCCEALGTPGAGRAAAAGAFGFYPNKQITSGEGGAIVTDDGGLAAAARILRNQGRTADRRFMVHERLGYNYRLPDILCALLSSQLARLPEIVERRARVAALYNDRLEGLPLRLPTAWRNEGVSWFVYVVELPERAPAQAKERVIADLAEHGVAAGAYFTPIHLQPFYRSAFGYREGTFPRAEYVGARTIALPFSTRLQGADVEHVCRALRSALERNHIGGPV